MKMAEKKSIIRCAVYTRKSTDEGLDQAFNSLDAQRDACEAYITSQRHEGWQLLPTFYDDGGFSGGSMDRPGLTQLLADIAAGKIDVVVVYKIDRLTRSLSDFSKIIDVLDKAGASFVSVTQSFNTQTSMGRLMLHVLLSFAQFEREVTTERIKDKIAASKRKGLWMGGNPPLGYDVQDRMLVINQTEAETVRMIFERYVQLRSVRELLDWLNDQGIMTKARAKGRGGAPFKWTSLRIMLSNHLYIGEIHHQGSYYPGQHDAIINQDLWDAVQAAIAEHHVTADKGRRAQAPSLLSGLLYDPHGRKMTPSHAAKKGQRYRYYITHGKALAKDAPAQLRVPATSVEAIVTQRLAQHLTMHAAATALDIETAERIMGKAKALEAGASIIARAIITDYVQRIDLTEDTIDIHLDPGISDDTPPILTGRITKLRRGNDAQLVLHAQPPVARDVQLVQLIADAHAARHLAASRPKESADDLAQKFDRSTARFKRLLRLSYLAPDIVQAILAGTQPSTLTSQTLHHIANLPSDWSAQRQMLGFA
jgi:site-specific DNA recombinase